MWLGSATALGPSAPPLPQALAIGALVLSVPWWAHRRRRAWVRVERKLQAWPDIARAIGLAGSQVMSATVDVWGWRVRFRLARGQTITDVTRMIPALESGLGTFRGADNGTDDRTSADSATLARQPAMSDQEREAVRQAGADDARRSRVEHGFPERIEDPAAVAKLTALLRDIPWRRKRS